VFIVRQFLFVLWYIDAGGEKGTRQDLEGKNIIMENAKLLLRGLIAKAAMKHWVVNYSNPLLLAWWTKKTHDPTSEIAKEINGRVYLLRKCLT